MTGERDGPGLWKRFGAAARAAGDGRRAWGVFGGLVARASRRNPGDDTATSLQGEANEAEATDDTSADGARIQAQKMEALGRLTGGVAHDFNNLLTVVLGNATALRVHAEARGDSQAVRRAEMIERAAERGGRLAGQLLSFARKQMLRPDVVSVFRVLSATHELLAQAAGESTRVILQAEPGLWNCLVDPGQLESAILNLVLNARDAMPLGGNINISCHNVRIGRSLMRKSPAATGPGGNGDYVRIDVIDTGTGIPPELQKKVFEPFFTTKPVGQGSGLGLAQVHGFAGQSGGWVRLESTVGRGTTVSLFLPRAADGAAEPSAATNASVARGDNQTVVVVEPDEDLRATSCETLSRNGYRAVGVSNGSGALALLAADERIDVLLIEARLPGGVNGRILARSARQVRPDLCVLMTSGTMDDVPDEASRASLDGDKRFDFVMKPYRAPDLVRMVSAVLSSNTFSFETEQLLAEAKQAIPHLVSFKTAPGASESAPAIGAGVRNNTIRLGVMPFRTIGLNDDAAFSRGLAEEITTAFSRFRWITCVGPASVAAVANEPYGESEPWQALDLDFLVEGSFRKKGNAIRVLLRLTNMRGSGEISWGQRFDGLLPDLLDLQDRIASETAAQVAPEMLVWEGLEAKARPRVNPTAYDMMLRAIPAVHRLDELAFRESGELLEQSLALDPSSAACHSWLAHWYHLSVGQGWQPHGIKAIERADQLAQQAVMLDPDDARAFAVAGHVRAFLHKDAEGALRLHERAIALNPNLALAWCYSGLAHGYLGQHAEAIRRIERAQRLSPLDPYGFFYDTALSMPLLLSGQHETAVQLGRRSREAHPGYSSTHKGLLAALGHLGRLDEAAAVRRELFRLEPHFSLREARSRSPLLRSEDLDCYVGGLRLAGIPERSRLEPRPALTS
jgi:signal transduction histidine kinase/TolB-like protein/FixJ family two-component response regulator